MRGALSLSLSLSLSRSLALGFRDCSAAPTGVKRAQSTLRAMQLRYLDELHQVGCCIFRFLGQYDILQRAQLPRVRTVTMGMRRRRRPPQNAEARFNATALKTSQHGAARRIEAPGRL